MLPYRAPRIRRKTSDSSIHCFISEYRQRRFADAAERAQKSFKRSNVRYLQAEDCAVMAMAHWQLGKKVAAREMFAKGNALAPVVFAEPEPSDNGDTGVAWIIARISLDEATTLIEAPAAQGR
jgi:hypothetical protein